MEMKLDTQKAQPATRNLKISISYPPLESDKGIPLLSQNRQFQWFSEPTYIYPMVPAYAATLLGADLRIAKLSTHIVPPSSGRT